MGEIADMMIDGTLDSITGEYLGPGGGYPWTRYNGRSEINGVKNYLKKYM